jgi:hypothetical protein
MHEDAFRSARRMRPALGVPAPGSSAGQLRHPAPVPVRILQFQSGLPAALLRRPACLLRPRVLRPRLLCPAARVLLQLSPPVLPPTLLLPATILLSATKLFWAELGRVLRTRLLQPGLRVTPENFRSRAVRWCPRTALHSLDLFKGRLLVQLAGLLVMTT